MVARTMLAVLLVTVSAAAWGSDATRAAPAATAGAPKRSALEDKLAKKISFEYVDTPLSECLIHIQSLCKANIILDPRATGGGGWDVPINLKVSDMKAALALEWVIKLAELECVNARRAVFISTERHVSALRRRLARKETADREAGLPDRLRKKITFEFVDTPLGEAMEFLQVLMKMEIRVEGAFDCPITLTVRDMAAADAFWWVARLAGCDAKVAGGAIVMVPSKKLEPNWREELEEKLYRRVNWYYRESPLGEGVVGLLCRHGVQVHLDAGALEREKTPVTMKLSNARLGAALGKVLRPAGLDYCLRPGEVYISTPAMVEWERSVVAAAEKLRAEERRRPAPSVATAPASPLAAAATLD